jgi:hypothetical protein
MLTAKQIPSTDCDGWTAPIDAKGGYTVRVKVDIDECIGEPWKEHDGHGIVSEWRSRNSKQPGEMLLCGDGGHCRFYDFAATVKIAKRDGWDAQPYGGTAGERAHRATLADFEYLRRWCNGDWGWVVVSVEVSRNGALVAEDCCGGIESEGDYWREHAAEVANGSIQYDKAERAKAGRAKAKETRERQYWANRDTITV